MKNVIGQHNLEPGAAWTFVHADGRRVLYEYEKRICPASPSPDKGPGNDAMHALFNPLTRKCAQVTEKWLREGPIASGTSETGFRSHWLIGEVKAELADAA